MSQLRVQIYYMIENNTQRFDQVQQLAEQSHIPQPHSAADMSLRSSGLHRHDFKQDLSSLQTGTEQVGPC